MSTVRLDGRVTLVTCAPQAASVRACAAPSPRPAPVTTPVWPPTGAGAERCTFSGKVLECSGGRIAVARWTSSETVDLGRDPAPPELIAERWPEIDGAAA